MVIICKNKISKVTAVYLIATHMLWKSSNTVSTLHQYLLYVVICAPSALILGTHNSYSPEYQFCVIRGIELQCTCTPAPCPGDHKQRSEGKVSDHALLRPLVLALISLVTGS